MKNIIKNICSVVLIIIGGIAGSVLICNLFRICEIYVIIVNNFLGITPDNALFVFVEFVGMGFLLRIIIDGD